VTLLHGVIIIIIIVVVVVVGEGRDFVCLELRPLWGPLPSSKHRGVRDLVGVLVIEARLYMYSPLFLVNGIILLLLFFCALSIVCF
jgi:hypothetical protein